MRAPRGRTGSPRRCTPRAVRPAGVSPLGQSKCQQHAYAVCLWRCPIVLTVDVGADFDAAATNWMAENLTVFRLDAPSYEPASEFGLAP